MYLIFFTFFTGQINILRVKAYQLGRRLFLPAGGIIFDGPIAGVVPDQFQIGVAAGANELKITIGRWPILGTSFEPLD